MWRKISLLSGFLVIAFGILLVSILRTAAVKYDFTGESTLDVQILGDSNVRIDYDLPYQGRIVPDSPLWPLKALRDKIWLFVTSNSSRKAELSLLFADKRLASAKILFQNDKPEIAFTTLSKAEKYLEESLLQENKNRKKGMNTSDFLKRLALASLKHYEVMDEIVLIAPEDAKPKIIETQSYARKVYESSRDALNEKGITPPESPFNW